ncbi:hypothetical protein B0H34DRAFT_247254 [Crassisporium funariophilum]|nr:hypothetical protein B0H34DRAFT_247254 [Crassisporium funariophilum]
MAESQVRNTRSQLGLQWLKDVVNGLSNSRNELYSPFSYLLYSNTAPSDSEIALIRKFIAATQLELTFTNVDSKRNIQQDTLARYTAFVRVHDAILSPIRKIPSELLEKIFRHYATSIIQWQHVSRIQLPWVLSQVCQRWRAIVLRVPSLWSHVPAIHLLDKRRKTQTTIKYLNELFARSRDAPLTFNIYAPRQEYDTHPVLDVLVHHSERWQVLTIESSCITINALQRSRGRLSSLHTLTLDIGRFPGTSVIDIFKDAPRLREVNITGHYPHALFLPWSQLTRYREVVLTRGGRNEVYSASHLEILVLSIACDTTIIPVTTLCHLKILRITWSHTMLDVEPFFQNLTLPAIREILIGCLHLISFQSFVL